jgi:hypothetical protein
MKKAQVPVQFSDKAFNGTLLQARGLAMGVTHQAGGPEEIKG